MSNVKYDCYSFTDEAEFLQSLTDSGYILNDGEPLRTENIITDSDSGENLDMHYNAEIPLNLPDTGDGWSVEMSTDVFMLCARVGNIKLPSNKKVGGNLRKYYWEFINVYFGEPSP